MVNADDDALLSIDFALIAVGGIRDFALEEAGLNSRDDATQFFDPVEVLVGLVFKAIG